MKESQNIHYRTCNYCEAMCGLKITYNSPINCESDIKIAADKNDPFSKGAICPKSQALAPLQFDEEKLRYPVKKVGSEWVEISWDEAYDIVEKGIKKIRSKYGADAIGTYLGNPIVHNLGMMLFIKMFTESLESKNIFSATSMDQLPHHFVSHYMFGHEMRIPVPDIDRTKYMLIMGANPLASNGSIMTSAGAKKRLKNIIDDGGKVVFIDPRESESAKVASEHHFIKPNSDLYFLLAFLHICFRDKKYNLGRLQEHIVGFEHLEPLCKTISPKIAAQYTLIKEESIEKLAKEYFESESAVIYGRLGISTQTNGGLNHWLITVLNIISNNFDKEGGMMFPSPAIELVRGKEQNEVFGRFKSRVSGLKEFAGELPVSAMAEEFSTSGEGQLKAFVSVCGNPVLSSPNGKLLDETLEDVEFMLSIDNYINETTHHADIILPTPSGLEIDNYDLVFSALSVHNSAKFYEALVEIKSDRVYDWQMLKELSSRLNENGLNFIQKLMTPKRIINIGLLFGEYGKFSSVKKLFSGLSLNTLLKFQNGVDLGALRSRVPEALITKDKKIHIAPTIFTEHLKKILATPAEIKKEDEFYLIGRRNLLSTNTWMHQVEKLSSSKNVRCTALIHPSCADKLNLIEGEEVLVSSKVGEIKIAIEITDAIMEGVISIPHGFGHTRDGVKISHAQAKAGVSINDITEHKRVDTLTGNAAFSSQVINIKKINQESSDE